ncbi:putative portal protein [Pelagibacter phage HTVC104P]|nr:putative portal protein [Pelagibacter phage HTVC104P]
MEYNNSMPSEEFEKDNKEDKIEPLVAEINYKFKAASDKRQDDEDRWLQAYHNYRGKYYKNIQFTEREKSRVFVKVTKTKVLAAYGQIIDVLFGTGKFPLIIQETKIPEGISEYAHMNPMKEKMGDENMQPTPSIEGNMDYTPGKTMNMSNGGLGFPGDGNELAPGATFDTLNEVKLGSLQEKYGEAELSDGPAPQPEFPQIKPAQMAARQLNKLIEDQLDESNANVILRNAIFESCLLGTGIIKGPFTFNKTLHRYNLSGNGNAREYAPEFVKVPRIEFCSVWDFYPDPNARSMDECEYVIHRHRLNRQQFKDLINRPFFNREKILECLEMGGNYTKQSWETDLDLENNTYGDIEKHRYEVLEYWGTVDAFTAREYGLEIDEAIEDTTDIQVNIWTVRGKVIRIVENPFKPFRIPYQAFNYEKNPYQFFGIGVPENMDDAQSIMNGHARMAIDNLALAGNLVFDIDESALVNNQSMEVFPGKIFKRQAGVPGQAIYGIKFPNTAPENMQMFDKFRQLADESTGIPSYSHGQTGVQSMTRTASGMSMLMGAASLNIKTVIKNIDDSLIKPLGESMFQWNMQFYEGELPIIGDFEIKATGSSSLMRKEVRSQRLTMFLQTIQNPQIAPFVRISEVIKELAYSLDLDPDEILNSKDEAEIHAKIIGYQNVNQGTSPQAPDPNQLAAMAASGGVPQQGAGADNTGNGEIPQPTDNPPMPGQMEFSGEVEEPA